MDCKLRAKNCGGCPMLGMDYAAQLKQKEETVKKLLGRFGPVEHIRGMETPYHYRNKVISTFTTGWGADRHHPRRLAGKRHCSAAQSWLQDCCHGSERPLRKH